MYEDRHALLSTKQLPFVSDVLSCVHGSAEEHDFYVRSWNVSDVWRPNA